MCKKFTITQSYTVKEVEEILLNFVKNDLKGVVNSAVLDTAKINLSVVKNEYIITLTAEPDKIVTTEETTPVVKEETNTKKSKSILNTIDFLKPEPKEEKKEVTVVEETKPVNTVTYEAPTEDEVKAFPTVGWVKELSAVYPELASCLPPPHAIDADTYLKIKFGTKGEIDGVFKSSLLWFEFDDLRFTTAIKKYWPSVDEGYKISDSGNASDTLADIKEDLYISYMSAYMRQHKNENGHKLIMRPLTVETKEYGGHHVNTRRVIRAVNDDKSVYEYIKLPNEPKLIKLKVRDAQ